MKRKSIDLTDIKEEDLDKTSSFTDLLSRSEKKNRTIEKNISDINDIEDMVEEKKRNTKDLTIELEKAKTKSKDDDEKFNNTQILEITRQMKYNFEEIKNENAKNKKKGISVLNIIGEINLLCSGYYIYLLAFTNYQDDKISYMISGGFIVLLVLLFGLSVITNKRLSKVFNILNILAILSFIVFNIYTLLN